MEKNKRLPSEQATANSAHIIATAFKLFIYDKLLKLSVLIW